MEPLSDSLRGSADLYCGKRVTGTLAGYSTGTKIFTIVYIDQNYIYLASDNIGNTIYPDNTGFLGWTVSFAANTICAGQPSKSVSGTWPTLSEAMDYIGTMLTFDFWTQTRESSSSYYWYSFERNGDSTARYRTLENDNSCGVVCLCKVPRN